MDNEFTEMCISVIKLVPISSKETKLYCSKLESLGYFESAENLIHACDACDKELLLLLKRGFEIQKISDNWAPYWKKVYNELQRALLNQK